MVLLSALYLIFPLFAGFPLTEATMLWCALRIEPCFALGCAVCLVWRSGRISSIQIALAMAAVGLTGLVTTVLLHGPDLATVIFCANLIPGLGLAARAGSSVLSQG
ncbi:hypothetical protein ABAC460_17595 [Asticcacaulis sp. AC460]|nr:hypothetical protein ABAC460_17595 [Asticcacaulis sp. AC460]